MLSTPCSAQDLYGVPSLVMEGLGQLPAGLGWDGMGWETVVQRQAHRQQGRCAPGAGELLGCSERRLRLSPLPSFGRGALVATWPFPLQHPRLRLALLLALFLFSSGNIWKPSEKH